VRWVPHRRARRECDLVDARQLGHAHDVDLVPALVAQAVQRAHERVVVRRAQHPAAPVLAGDVRDDRARAAVRVRERGRGAGRRGELDDRVAHGRPEVRAARERERARGGAARGGEDGAAHRGRAVREQDAVEDERAPERGAIRPVLPGLDGTGREGGAEDELVQRGVVAPACAGVLV
jgi:hypothetical protein